MENYQIITDATVDLSGDFIRQNNIEVIPMQVTIGNKEYTYIFEDGEISAEDFFHRMRLGEMGRTSQINHEVYREYFEKFLKQGKDILYIGFSSALSGTVQASKICMEELREKYPQRKMICMDSLCACAGEGLLVYTAAQKQKEGMGICELYSWLEENKLNLIHWFTVEDLEYLHRGGRLNAAVTIVGGALQIKPVMHMNNSGHLENVDKVRGRKHSILALFKKMEKTYTPEISNKVFICHGDCYDDALDLSNMIKNQFPETDIHIFHMGPIIGSHTGAGVLALFFWGSQR